MPASEPDHRDLPPRYEPAQVEKPLYARWLEARAFHADEKAEGRGFCIVIPPPNVTGSLHLGHALDNTLQDILVRFKRMQGFNTCWVPGTDHAGIATQVVVERELKKEGLTRHDLGRDGFLERVWKWKEQSGNRIVEQLKLMGCSCDWDRECFTMDETRSRAVLEHFVRLYEEGLIYRGERIVNWCPRCWTALSDLEIKHVDRGGSLWHIRYRLKDGADIVLATTRPETLLGDTAVAVNPDDKRYSGLVGKTAILPLVNREVPVIADSYVDKSFGTGIVKITPGHDPNDFEIGLRHKLEIISIMNLDATLNEAAGPYAGLDRYKARERVNMDLERKGLLVKVEPHRSAVGHCARCDTELEPLVSKQWFVRTKELAKAAREAVRRGEMGLEGEEGDKAAIKLVPDSAYGVFYEWMDNIRDWCISRQLWWGHRIPAWYCATCGQVTVARAAPAKCTCGGKLEQDPDVLDTWFSSALWPFSTLGWPEETKEMKAFYPTSVLVTGWDIIFFWVARMIMAGLKLTGRIPFHSVVLHSLITDPEGKKMSKSRGNVMDPLDLFDRFGTDAVRFTLAGLETLKQSFRLSEQKVEHSRNFMNKIWNAARFALPELKGFAPSERAPKDLSVADRWILRETSLAAQRLTRHLETCQFNAYAAELIDLFWFKFCDAYIELAKPALKDEKRRAGARWTLWKVLDTTMRLMHPVIPYITEEIWRRLPPEKKAGELLMKSDWAGGEQPAGEREGLEAAAIMEVTMRIVDQIRLLKHEQDMPAGESADIAVRPAGETESKRLKEALGLGYVETLCRARAELLGPGSTPPGPNVSSETAGCTVFLKVRGSPDPASEHKRLKKEKEELEALLRKTKASLENKDYLAKAPPPIVEEARRKAGEYEARVGRLATRLARLR